MNNATNNNGPKFKKGDQVRILPEFCDVGEEAEVYTVREDSQDERGEMPRLNISANCCKHMALWPILRIEVRMIEKV